MLWRPKWRVAKVTCLYGWNMKREFARRFWRTGSENLHKSTVFSREYSLLYLKIIRYIQYNLVEIGIYV